MLITGCDSRANHSDYLKKKEEVPSSRLGTSSSSEPAMFMSGFDGNFARLRSGQLREIDRQHSLFELRRHLGFFNGTRQPD